MFERRLVRFVIRHAGLFHDICGITDALRTSDLRIVPGTRAGGGLGAISLPLLGLRAERFLVLLLGQ